MGNWLMVNGEWLVGNELSTSGGGVQNNLYLTIFCEDSGILVRIQYLFQNYQIAHAVYLTGL